MLARLEIPALDQIGKSGDYMLGNAYYLAPLLLERGLYILLYEIVVVDVAEARAGNRRL